MRPKSTPSQTANERAKASEARISFSIQKQKEKEIRMRKHPKPSPIRKAKERKTIRVGFRVKASECEQRKARRDAKNARRAFFVLKQKRKTCGKNFFSFCENSKCSANKTLLHEKKAFFSQKFFTKLRKSPYFWGKKRCLLKKGILVGRISSRFFQKPNTPFHRLLCLYNLLGFLGCSLLLGFPLAPTLRAGASPSRGSFGSLRSLPCGARASL